jgi:hypothetical protein
MDNLAILQGMDAAIALLLRKRAALAGGSMAIWDIVNDAAQHLDRQVAERLAPCVPHTGRRVTR